jgi:hypothetical protein
MTADAGGDGSVSSPATVRPSTADRATDVRLARLHLRTGATALARAELEWLAAVEALDVASLADLAVARWRTGELELAAEAAAAHLEQGGSAAGALVVAAEAAAADQRDEVAAGLVARAVAATDGATLEAIIAGRPLQAHWPGELQPGAVDGTSAGQPDPLRLARIELEAGRFDAAALRLALVVRREPDLAAAVLEAIGEQTSVALALVRGDALRLLGREAEAERAFAAAEADLDR